MCKNAQIIQLFYNIKTLFQNGIPPVANKIFQIDVHCKYQQNDNN